MSSTIAELERKRAAARLGGGEKRIAAQHARHGAGDQSLVFLDQLLERNGVASTDKPHEAHVVGVFFRSPFISAIVTSHRSL